jgi:phosphotriesterase-related protein
VNKGPLDALDRKIVQAAAIASRESGLTIASHTGDGAAALEQLEIVRNPSRFVWVHAQNEKDLRIHEQVARAGAWVELDGIRAESAEAHLAAIRYLADHDLLGRVLLSQDSGWYHVGEPGGGKYRGYSYLFTEFLPKLPQEWRRILMWENPRKAFGG